MEEEIKELKKQNARRFYRSIGGLALAFTVIVCAIFGAAYILDSKRYRTEKESVERIKGYPLGVEYDGGDLSIAVRDENGQIQIYHGRTENYIRQFSALDAKVLIESEMKDGDNEPVEIGGIYRDKVFEIWSVSANGYTIGKLEN